MKAQVSYEFVGGAILFFTALTIVVSLIFTQFPVFSRSARVNRLYQQAWSVSNSLVNHKGYWEDGLLNGTNWQIDPSDVRSLGLAASNRVLDQNKVEELASGSLSYDNITDLLGTDNDLWINITEYVVVDSYRSYRKSGSVPGYITPPSGSSQYTNAKQLIHYGNDSINGESVSFLVARLGDSYDYVWTSKGDWDFSASSESFNLTDQGVLTVNGDDYVFNNKTTETGDSTGRLILLEHDLANVGKYNPVGETSVVVKRYATLKDNIAEIKVELW